MGKGMSCSGDTATKESKEDKVLNGVINRAQTRLGNFAISGRFHKSPRVLTDDYDVSDIVLGSGYNGSVYKATAKDSGLSYAVKDFKLTGITPSKMQELEGECEIFLSMDHPHVARLADVYQSKEKMSLVMECMEGGELFDRVIERKKFTEKDAADAAYQMLLSLAYLHNHGMVHRDIKLENFLYEKKEGDHLKMIDFGFSKILVDPSIKMKMSCGTLSYVAPEVLAKDYTNKCDTWSLGVVVFILICGYMPFSGDDKKQITDIKQGAFTQKEAFRKLSPTASDFLRKLICVNVGQRLSAEDALNHEFITKRSDRAAAAASAEVDDSVAKSIINFAEASKFRRACLTAMAWSLTNEERTKLRDDFLKIDKTQSGTITLPEFKAVVEERFHLDDVEVKVMFDKLDTASTEEIHYTDFLAAMVSSRIALHDDLLKATFRRFDVGHTGYIEVSDLKTVLGETFEGTEVAALLQEADVDHDGKVSWEEFVAFAKADAAIGTNAHEVSHKLVDRERQKLDSEAPPTGSGFQKAFKPRADKA